MIVRNKKVQRFELFTILEGILFIFLVFLSIFLYILYPGAAICPVIQIPGFLSIIILVELFSTSSYLIYIFNRKFTDLIDFKYFFYRFVNILTSIIAVTIYLVWYGKGCIVYVGLDQFLISLVIVICIPFLFVFYFVFQKIRKLISG